MIRHAWAALALLVLAISASAADLRKIERRIKKEPAYATKSPRYALLVLGPDARDRVWLVKDGDTLYVDRNGDGDLTGANEKLSPKQRGRNGDVGRDYDVGEFNLSGRKIQRLNIGFVPLKTYLIDELARRKDILSALEKDPNIETMNISLEAEMPHLKAKGHVAWVAGPIDRTGPLLLATKAAEAPILHFGGPVQIDFFLGRPTLRRGRARELTLAVGTPGFGSGTSAMLAYHDTIPADIDPVCEIAFPPAKAGDEPVKKRYELKERC